MSGYAFHPEAFADLDEIWEYIAEDNVDAADRVLVDIHSTLTTLAGSPQIGHRRPDLTTRPLRFHVVREAYLIAYAPDEKLCLPVRCAYMSFSPCPRIRKNVATAASSRPLTINTVGAEPTCVTSQPLASPPSGEPPRNATM